MRIRARTDANQTQIVAALRGVGATVQHMHQLGKGCPDLLVGFRGVNYVMEIKDGDKPLSAQRLTPDEQTWVFGWGGAVDVVNSVDDALDRIGAVKAKKGTK